MNTAMKIRIYPIKRFYSILETFEGKDDVAAIICTTDPVSKAKLSGIRYIHVSFADVTASKRFDAFRPEKAQRIKRFVKNIKDTKVLYVCCDSGESRSAAVAAAILRYWGKDEMAIWKNVRFHPNPLVYHLQSKAFKCPSSKLRAVLLTRYNRWLFRKQIKAQRK